MASENNPKPSVLEKGLQKADDVASKLLLVSDSKNDSKTETTEKNLAPESLSLDRNKLPLRFQTKKDDRTGRNIMSRLLDAQINPDDHKEFLKSITAADITNLFKESARLHLDDKGKTILAPTRYGTENLSEKDLTQFRLFKKDHKSSLTIEMSLQWLTTYHEDNQCSFSEETLRKHLSIIVPDDAVHECILYQRKHYPLADIYDILNESYGSKKTSSEISQEISKLTQTSKTPSAFMEALHRLLIRSQCEDTQVYHACYNAAHDFLKSHCSFGITHAIDNHVKAICDSDQPDFFHLFRAFKRFALEADQEAKITTKKSTMHNIESTDPTEMINSMIDSKLSLIQNDLTQVTETLHEIKMTNKKCHHCGSEAHLVRDCPQKQNMISQPSNALRNQIPMQGGYSAEPCIMHPSGNHTNAMCVLQKGPCTFRPNHSGHSAGMCRRTSNQQTQPLLNPQRNNSNAWNQQPFNPMGQYTPFPMGNPFMGMGYGYAMPMNPMMGPQEKPAAMPAIQEARVSHIPCITDESSTTTGNTKMDDFLQTVKGAAAQTFKSSD